MVRAVVVTVAACVFAATLVGQSSETWRAQGLASFDDVWQTVNDTFYEPAAIGVDWGAVRRELRPQAEAATSADGIRRAIEEMLSRLQRSHFVLLSASEAAEFGPIGPDTVRVDVRLAAAGLVVVRVDRESAAAKVGLAPGQIVLAIDGLDTSAWTPAATGQNDRRRAFDLWRRAWRALHGDPGSIAQLDVRLPGGAERVIAVAREHESGEMVTLGNLPSLAVRTDVRELRSASGRRAGYIGFNVWMTPIDTPVAEAFERFRNADGVILDLRGNPGGLAAMMSGIAGHLIGDGNVRLGRMQTRQAALEFRVNPRVVLPDGRATTPYRGPVAVLVDELTASTSECFTGALQDLRRARVFGRPTMGEALPALTKRLSNGDVLMYAIGNFVTGTGRSLERNGVQPDEVVPLSVDALAGGRDETVEAALRWLDTKPLALTAPLLLSSNDLQARQSFRVSRRRPTPARRGQATLKRSAPRNRSADRSAPGTVDPAVKDSEHSAMDSLREK